MSQFLKNISYKSKAMNAHGLHSPLVYDLYTDILAEKKSFYVYGFIDQLFNKDGDFQVKEAQLLYQLLNKYDFKKGLIMGPGQASIKRVMSTISKDLEIDLEFKEGSHYEFIHFCSDCSASDINRIPLKSYLGELQFISVSHPHKNVEQKALWEELTTNSHVSVTIDLWSMGISFPTNKQKKQHFTLQNKHFQF